MSVKKKKSSTKILHFEKTPFEFGHFSNGKKIYEAQIPLLFS